MSWGGRRVSSAHRICRLLGGRVLSGPQDCLLRGRRIEIKDWRNRRCVDRWYLRRELRKGAEAIAARCFSAGAKELAKREGVLLLEF